MADILNRQVRRAIVSGRLVHLVTLNSDGSPQVSCVYVGLNGDEILAGSLGEHRKLHNIRRDDGSCCLSRPKEAWRPGS